MGHVLWWFAAKDQAIEVKSSCSRICWIAPVILKMVLLSHLKRFKGGGFVPDSLQTYFPSLLCLQLWLSNLYDTLTGVNYIETAMQNVFQTHDAKL